MLYKVLKRTIQRYIASGDTEALAEMEEKLDIFLAAGKVTIEQYEELIEMLNNN